MDNTWIFNFGDGQADGGMHLKDVLGTKGANLAEMTNLGLPVPPGFTIPTHVCKQFYAADCRLPAGLDIPVETSLALLEKRMGRKFGDPANPLLISVRSGAPVSMPGMLDTITNLGLNDATVEGLAAVTGDERFAYDCYRRFIESYSGSVLNIGEIVFEEIGDEYKEAHGLPLDSELTASDLKALIAAYKEIVIEKSGAPFPEDPRKQLQAGMAAVFKSWMNPQAVDDRKANEIPETMGTAISIQAMVFGNKGMDSAAGTAFTRNTMSGVNRPYGNFLTNAQGHDLVSGSKTGDYLTIRGRELHRADRPSFEEAFPDAFKRLLKIFAILEKHYRDMQDVEFTVENGRLWILQTRDGKRSAEATRVIAVDMANEGLITRAEAVARAESAMSLDQLTLPQLDPSAKLDVLTTGKATSPGVATGIVLLNPEEVVKAVANSAEVILCRSETSVKDMAGIRAAKGILTSRGDRTCHAALSALNLGKPCIVGAHEMAIDYLDETITIGRRIIQTGDIITIDGSTGNVMLGAVPTIQPQISESANTLIRWKKALPKLAAPAVGPAGIAQPS